MSKTHVLKVLSCYFEDIWEGDKSFEVRVNDRNYVIEDTLFLKECGKNGNFTNRTLTCKINYILSLNALEGLEKSNYVVLGLKDFRFTVT